MFEIPQDHSTKGTDKEPPSSDTADAPETSKPDDVAQPERDYRFWALLVSISLASLLTSLEATITSTALPSIVGDLGGGHLYVWAVNGYLLTM